MRDHKFANERGRSTTNCKNSKIMRKLRALAKGQWISPVGAAKELGAARGTIRNYLFTECQRGFMFSRDSRLAGPYDFPSKEYRLRPMADLPPWVRVG